MIQEMRDYVNGHPTRPPYYEAQARILEHIITRQLESTKRRGDPGFNILKFRYVVETNADGEKDLQAVRARYWGEREEEAPRRCMRGVR
jgi:hypothetical protein